MQTKPEPDRVPDANRGPAVKRKSRNTWGVRKLPTREGRPNPYGVQWRETVFDDKLQRLVSRAKTLFFPTAEARDGKFEEQARLRRAGMLTESASRDELRQFRAFKEATHGVPWQVVVAGWRENLVAHNRQPCTVKIADAVLDYLAKMRELRDRTDAAGKPAGKLSPDTYRQKRHKLELFAEQFGHLTLDAVPGVEIATWIDDFDEVESDWTFDNYRKQIGAFYGYFVERKTIAANPVADIKRRSDGVGEVKKISPAQTAQLFHTALTFVDPRDGQATFKRIVGRLALEAFIGLRFSSGKRIEKTDINFTDRGISLPRKKLKTGMVRGGRKHYIDELPAQIWDWLAVTPEACWTLEPGEYLKLKSALFGVADVPHPHNCLRHGFCTYDIAANKNPGRTAVILCHKDQQELWDHYNGEATSEQGRLYQRITPQTAALIAEGFGRASALAAAAPATPAAAPLRLPA